MPNAKVSLLCACAGAALALPGAASAQIDPGVNYDPGSPAGKEYAIPLVEGRSEGAGTEDQQDGANVPFGLGVTPPGGGHGKKAGSGGNAGSGKNGARRESSRDNGPQGARPGESSEELTGRIAAAETPGGTASRSLLLALAVLLPAALLAFLLRHHSQVSR